AAHDRAPVGGDLRVGRGLDGGQRQDGGGQRRVVLLGLGQEEGEIADQRARPGLVGTEEDQRPGSLGARGGSARGGGAQRRAFEAGQGDRRLPGGDARGQLVQRAGGRGEALHRAEVIARVELCFCLVRLPVVFLLALSAVAHADPEKPSRAEL